MIRPLAASLALCATLAGGVCLSACGGDVEEKDDKPAEPAPAEPAAKKAPEGPLPGLILVQARFEKVGGRPKPKPATMWLFRTDGEEWYEELVEDPGSNVFHKGIHWRDGILTIGAMEARLTHWKRGEGGAWTPNVLWKQSWGGKFDRLRDIELADVTGDGKEDIVLATHDMGVVAVGTENEDGTWSFAEMDKTPDTFVHEIEIGDVDGDGKKEFYATPSERNKSSGASQPGAVSRYDYVDGKFERSWVVQWEESHAKEILVTDVDGDGTDELYAVREAHIEVRDEGGTKEKERIEPVKIVQMVKGAKGWEEKVATTLDDDMCRFLLPTDANHDGKTDLVAAGKKSGLWLLQRKEDGTFENTLIDADTGGFEHATHAADLDGDGKVELYVASDDQKELRRYVWDGAAFQKTVISEMPDRTITWNIQDGKF